MLIPHLRDEAYVIHTYAAMTIERILFMKQDGALVFGQADVRPHAEHVLDALFAIIEKGQTPQQLAANDNLMKSKRSRVCALQIFADESCSQRSCASS